MGLYSPAGAAWGCAVTVCIALSCDTSCCREETAPLDPRWWWTGARLCARLGAVSALRGNRYPLGHRVWLRPSHGGACVHIAALAAETEAVSTVSLE